MTLAIFDLDNTLLAGDSDHAFGDFIAEQGIVHPVEHKRRNDAFYQDYLAGKLDIQAYQRFAIEPFKGRDRAELDTWHAQFMRDKLAAMRSPKADALIAKHRAKGDTLMIITATNSFVTRPIADALGIALLLATEPEIKNGYYTGEIAGVPCYREGKVTRLKQWLTENPQHTLDGSWFYSDSFNDLPLLEMVTHPVAVDADDTLLKIAQERGWQVMSLRS